MRLSRLLSFTVVVGAATGAMIVACGSDSGSKADAKIFKDSFVPMDAGANVIGKTCGSNADCGTGGLCITLRVSSGSGSGSAMTGHPFCSEACTQGAGDMCATGYTGTGFPVCLVSDGMGGHVCAVICAEKTSGTLCPNGSCNGTCPGTLTCTVPLSTGSGSAVMEVGSACF